MHKSSMPSSGWARTPPCRQSIATILPARRALRIDIAKALHNE
jgi:hypothetical protein